METKNSQNGVNDLEELKQKPEEVGVIVEYYKRAFIVLHMDESLHNYQAKSPHDIRSRFWKHLIPGPYRHEKAISLLKTYLRVVEGEMANIISQNSIAYWLHLSRRIAPRLATEDSRPMTVGLVRATLDAAFQKYGKFDPCDRVGMSKEIPTSKILGGLLLDPRFEIERKFVEETSQLVLTNFGARELLEFYEVEKLAFEVWKASAKLRIVGKGAALVVGGPPEYIRDERSKVLNTLVEIYDNRVFNRATAERTSSVGVMFEPAESVKEGFIGLPTYNLLGVLASEINPIAKNIIKTTFPEEMCFNFVWNGFNLRAFRSAHLPLAESFKKKHGVSLDSVLVAVAALAYRALYQWIEGGGVAFAEYWQRAYRSFKDKCSREGLKGFIEIGAGILGIKGEIANSLDIDAGLAFWQLNEASRSGMDLAYAGPHYFLLPFGEDRQFVDYAWLRRRLFSLFIGVSIPDQNFKGEALEIAVGRESSVLPKGVCRLKDGRGKQIDYAQAVGKHLIIGECKAVGMSIAFDRGDPQAIRYRVENVVKRALSEVDEKAVWLAQNPVGANYDVRAFDDILPIGVSPFVEFIDSLDKYYWITEEIPRVVTPSELKRLLEEKETIDNSLNRVPLKK
jgi:hypothetical protein